LNRKTNDHPWYNSLKTITFPTGGTTTYEYEPNQYRESYTNDPSSPIINGCGQRVKRIISKPDPNSPGVITSFKYGENEDGCGIVDVDFVKNIHHQFQSEKTFVDMTSLSFGYMGVARLMPIRTYSPKPMEYDMRFESPISYSKVSVYQEDESAAHPYGKT